MSNLSCEPILCLQIRNVVLYGTQGEGEKKKRLRLELVRWHPDKFTAKFGKRLAPKDHDRILQRVNATSQQLTGINSSLR